MTRRWVAAAVILACGLSSFLLLPQSPVTLVATAGTTVPIRGAIHVHTRRSDGTGTVEEVAEAAKRAGLQFVIFTDHGDGTKGSDSPVYRYGVLCIDALEVSTNGGHVVALDLPQTPFPLAGEVSDVVEDVNRMGGLSIAAHPDSRRATLGWTGWTTAFDGIEWLNGDSQWRDETWGTIARSLLTYPFRRAPTLAKLLDRPDELMSRWDALLHDRPVIALAAADAHARLGPGPDPYGRSLSLHLPAYEQVFRTLSISLPDVQLHGNADEDTRTVMKALREGHVFSSIDALASPALFSFTASSGSNHAVMGERLQLDGPVGFQIASNGPPGTNIKLLSDGKTVASGAPPMLEYEAPAMPAVYRVEIDVAGAPGSPPVPWVVSNPIYVGSRPVSAASPELPAVSETFTVYSDGPAPDWRIEKSVRSEGAISVVRSVEGTQLLLRYGLGGTLSESPYVAAVVATDSNVERFDRVTFTGRSMRPMRLMLEVRAGGDTDRRWGKSVYLDDMARTFTIAFAEMIPLGSVTGTPVVGELRDLMFVVDTVHTKQGASGQVWLDDIQYIR
jgi:hypothetical protein